MVSERHTVEHMTQLHFNVCNDNTVTQQLHNYNFISIIVIIVIVIIIIVIIYRDVLK